MTISAFRGCFNFVLLLYLIVIPSVSSGQSFDYIIDPRDGQYYAVVKIGDQWWMAQNLNIGDMTYSFFPQEDNDIIEKYCPDDDEEGCDIFGGIYQWDELMQYGNVEFNQGVCPVGWHVPSDLEWKTMELFIGMSPEELDSTGWRGTDEGGKLKSVGTSLWLEPNTGATDETGFSVLPAGRRGSDGFLESSGYCAEFWCTDLYKDSSAYCRYFTSEYSQIFRGIDRRESGSSVRCVKDSPYIFERGLLTDPRDEKQYSTVLIGNHWWMAENLNVGTWIDLIGDQTDNDVIQKYCYSNLGQYCDTFGGLYQWDEMMNYDTGNKQGICPDGWYIPSDEDWKELESELGMPEDELDSIGLRGTNEGLLLMEGGGSGLDLLLGGYIDYSGNSVSIHNVACPWTSTQSDEQKAFQRFVNNVATSIGRGAYFKSEATSVRCVSDRNATLTLAIEAEDTVCAGQEFSVRANVYGGNGTISYSWTSDPPGFYPTESTINDFAFTNTKYIVRVSDGSMYAKDSVIITVKSAPEFTIAGVSRVCPSHDNLEYSITGNPDYTYLWSPSDGTSTSATQNTVQISWGTTPGLKNLELQVTDTKTGCVVRKDYAVEVMPAPNKPTILLKGQSLLICPDSGLIYQWFHNDEAITGAKRQFYYANSNKSGYYTVETKLANQCRNESDPHSFELKSTEDWNDNESETVFIRPNPTSGNISMDIINDYTGQVNMIVINSIGGVVKQNTLYKYGAIFNTRIDLGELAEGAYFVIIEYSANREVHRVTIQK